MVFLALTIQGSNPTSSVFMLWRVSEFVLVTIELGINYIWVYVSASSKMYVIKYITQDQALWDALSPWRTLCTWRKLKHETDARYVQGKSGSGCRYHLAIVKPQILSITTLNLQIALSKSILFQNQVCIKSKLATEEWCRKMLVFSWNLQVTVYSSKSLDHSDLAKGIEVFHATSRSRFWELSLPNQVMKDFRSSSVMT